MGGPIDAVVAIGQDQSKIEMLQQQVVRAERLATLGELAAGVVHELNNPLTSITVYAEYLVRKLESQGSDIADLEKLRRIGASAQRILRFSRDLVQYARPSGRDLEPVDIAAVVRASVSICEHLVDRGGIALAVEVDPELPVIQAITGQLEQVLINLITNAVHAVEAKGDKAGRVVVRAQVESPSTILVEVADSGPGIAPEDREKIFEPFFTTKPDGKGTGLGLPIVRNIVEQHRGEISVARSDLGGAAFRVILPILEVKILALPIESCSVAPVMKPDVLLELLENAADQLGIRVSYDTLQTSVLHGGLCKVKGEYRIIIDKKATTEERVVTLATAIATFDTSELELPPKLREVLRTYEGTGTKPKRTAA